MEEQLKALEESMTKMQVAFGSFKGTLDEQKDKLVDDIGLEFANQRITIDGVVVHLGHHRCSKI